MTPHRTNFARRLLINIAALSRGTRLALIYFAALIFAAVAPFNFPKSSAATKEFLEYKAKAEQNDAIAQFNLGFCYLNGKSGVTNKAEAVKWFRKAADQNLAQAQYSLGVCYESGEGTEKDDVEAVEWFRKAADQNFADAQRALGLRYYTGGGVEKDYVEAVKWFHKAADQNDARAQAMLGFCHEDGHGGLIKDNVEAYVWLNLAAKTFGPAAEARDSLEKKISPQELVHAQKRTKELRARIDAKLNNDGK